MEAKDRSAHALNEKLWEVIEGLENKTLRVSEAKEMTNAAGKIIQLALTQLQANSMGAQVPVDLLDISQGGIQLKSSLSKKIKSLS